MDDGATIIPVVVGKLGKLGKSGELDITAPSFLVKDRDEFAEKYRARVAKVLRKRRDLFYAELAQLRPGLWQLVVYYKEHAKEGRGKEVARTYVTEDPR